MQKGRNLITQVMLILLIAPIIFLMGCQTTRSPTKAEIDETLSMIAPEVPLSPVMEKVSFEEKYTGLWLSFDDYRSLERNIIALREHIARLEVIIGFYQGESK